MVNQSSADISHGFGQTPVKLVKTLLSLKRDLKLMDFNTFGYFQPILALIKPPRFASEFWGKSLGLKWGYDNDRSDFRIT